MTIRLRKHFKVFTLFCFGSLAFVNAGCSEPQASGDERLVQSRKVFENDLCVVNDLNAAHSLPGEVAIHVKYDCKISPAPNSATERNQRIRETASARYDLACFRMEYKYFASGFDYYVGGSRMHWDSQGSSRPLPWRLIGNGTEKDLKILSLYKIWCN